ncbi:DUF6435 family protein [Marinomonas sp. 2405UD68-3]|uniref:DUF6435 family protein n=1 Tax=Marinomonas sp. 2405UD68-3 TaxID=3391835 RepID=UPI0039C8FB80
MFSIFKPNPIKKLKKLHDVKLEQAMQAQRKGDIRGYSQLTFEADEIHKEILALEEKNQNK